MAGENFTPNLPHTLTHLKITIPKKTRPYIPITIGDLPPYLSDLTLIYGSDLVITDLPDRLKKLTISKIVGSSTTRITLPTTLNNISHVSLGGDLVFPYETLPLTLTHLTLPDTFNSPINFSHLTNLTYLEFGEMFNQPIKGNNFPINLTYLFFGTNFNQPIDLQQHLSSLHTLTFVQFNKPVHSLPRNVKTLRLGSSFNQQLPNTLHSVTCLSMPTYMDSDELPPTLTHFYTGRPLNTHYNKLPQTLTHIYCPTMNANLMRKLHLLPVLR